MRRVTIEAVLERSIRGGDPTRGGELVPWAAGNV